MTVGNIVEIYLMAKDKVKIFGLDTKGHLFDGLAKDVPPGFYNWYIKRLSLEDDILVISARASSNIQNDYNEDLSVFDLKSCTWLDNNLKYVIKYKDTSADEITPQTLRTLDKELYNNALLDKFIIKDGYIVLSINDTKENIDRLNNR